MSRNARYCYEFGMLQHTPRSGFTFLGSVEQSVAEHTCRAMGIAFLLSRMVDEPLDTHKVVELLLFHDFPEGRSGDLNYVNQRYVDVDWDKLLGDLEQELPCGAEIVPLVREFEARATPEARVASDADQLEILVSLREALDSGNPRAADWIPAIVARLRTEAGRKLAEEIQSTHCDEWWFHNKKDGHWVHPHRRSV